MLFAKWNSRKVKKGKANNVNTGSVYHSQSMINDSHRRENVRNMLNFLPCPNKNTGEETCHFIDMLF